MTHIAKWWETQSDGKILCTLCPRYCKIGEGQAGFCYIRQNISGQLITQGYGKPTGFAIDPIEKKPLNHFFPGTEILSFGTAGCNLGCKFCQNWSMSKARQDEIQSIEASPEQVVQLTKDRAVPAIAFTYNDPIIFGEYVIDVSRLAREENIKSVMVTNGYIDPAARKEVFKYIDAANVDLKAFTEKFYYKLTGAHLQPVLDTLNWLKQETDVWIELTTLLIPGENDSEQEIQKMCDWILTHLGNAVPLHVTAFHPSFKMMDHPQTPTETLLAARQIALDAGLQYIYVGNVHHPEAQTTYCPNCNHTLIQRDWHSVTVINIIEGKCKNCGSKIAGRWAD